MLATVHRKSLMSTIFSSIPISLAHAPTFDTTSTISTSSKTVSSIKRCSQQYIARVAATLGNNNNNNNNNNPIPLEKAVAERGVPDETFQHQTPAGGFQNGSTGGGPTFQTFSFDRIIMNELSSSSVHPRERVSPTRPAETPKKNFKRENQ